MIEVGLSVVIPAYNEEARIARTLDRVLEYFDGRGDSYEVLVVSDGSTDATNSICERFAQAHPSVKLLAYEPNRGKGYAVRYGILRAGGARILFCDADLATPIEEIEKLEPYLNEGWSIAIGSRPLKDSELVVRQPFLREMLGRMFNKAVQMLAVKGIHDTQCGFKLFESAAAKEVFSRCRLNGFSFDFEALYTARLLGFKIAEVPIRWMHQPGSKVVPIRDGPKMIRDLIWLRATAWQRRQKLASKKSG
ncbi:MAG: glycosyltransferase family 2 protein [Armatimonadetes bacterium]|nr:glycosyltransferase family 2 protein [Armatimonadota bacterium]